MDSELLREPPPNGSEVDTLIGSLERQRRTFGWKTAGLDAEGLATRVGASTMTLGGLIKHVALVEDDYATVRILGRPLGPPWAEADFTSDPDWEWHSAAADEPAELYTLWAEAVSRCRAAFTEALADGGLDRPAGFVWPDGQTVSRRRLLVDLIEEYARHTGHADLLREAVDGRVGEDAPDTWT